MCWKNGRKIKEKLPKIGVFIIENISVVVPVFIIFAILMFGFTKNLLRDENFISYLEITIETNFLFFVLKEFKITRKSFDWNKSDRQEKEEKRKINLILSKIVADFIDNFEKKRFHLLKQAEDFEDKIMPVRLKKIIYNRLLKTVRKMEEDMSLDVKNELKKLKQEYQFERHNSTYTSYTSAKQLSYDSKALEENYESKQRYIEEKTTHHYYQLVCETLKNIKINYQQGYISYEIYEEVHSILGSEDIDRIYKKILSL